TPALDEQAIRERVEGEWSAKLQTIVSHLASDHEADVGKALEEKEAAKAEVRNLTVKLNSALQKLEAERHAREQLQIKMREAEEQLRSMAAARTAAPGDPPPPAEPPKPHEEERARAEVLEFAEQAQEALRRFTSPGDIPVPGVGKKSRILIVHHDPRFRSMWR